MRAQNSFPAASNPLEALCVAGGPRSGKTTALAKRAAAWAQPGMPLPPSGMEAQSFLFFCASPATVGSTKEILAAEGVAGGMVTTPFDYALRILADPRAQALTGRSPRVLSRDDEAVFFEDLKTSGLKRRRLGELWAFLLCGWANLDDDDPHWIKTTEEQAQLDLARNILTFEDALLAGEAVNLAVHALRENLGLRETFGSPVVLADDYPLMSRASQQLTRLLAGEKIAVAGDPHPAPAAFEPFPCLTGLDEFCDAHALVQRVALDEPFRDVRREWANAPDLPGEMRLIAAAVADALAAGTAPERIAVVGSNRTWRANLQQALGQCGLPARNLKNPRLTVLGREPKPVSDQERQRTLGRIAADPADSLAWRRWLSYGDALARSAAVSELREAAAAEGLTLAEALLRLDAGTLEALPPHSPFAQSLLGPYREAIAPMGAMPGGTPSPQKEADAAAIAVAAPEDLFGRTFDLVIFGGFVNGFIPSRDLCDPGVVVGNARTRAEAADRAAIRLVETRATGRLLFTGFETCPLEVAEHLKLHIARIALRDGRRICSIEPSDYLEELGPLS